MPFTGALFDIRGLYAQQGSQWVLVTGANPVPTGFYPTRIFDQASLDRRGHRDSGGLARK
jgi:hypothetical protein